MYEKGIFSLEPLNTPEKVILVDKSGAQDQQTVNTNEEESTTSDVQEIFLELRSKILQMDEEIVEKTTASYIAYRLTKSFVEVHLRKKFIILYLRPAEFNDPRNCVETIPESYNWSMNRRVYLKSADDIDYIMALVEQSYRDVI